MGNPTVCDIDLQPVELFQVREVLRCILHTIVFNRALGLVEPQTVDSQLFDSISYIHCGDSTVERKIDEKIQLLCSLVEKSPSFHSPGSSSVGPGTFSTATGDASLTRAQLSLSFFERRQVKKQASTLPTEGGVSAWFSGKGGSTQTPSDSSINALGSSSISGGDAGSGSISQYSSSSSSSKGLCWEQWNIHLSVLPQRQAFQQQQQPQSFPQQPFRALAAIARSASIGSGGSGGSSIVSVAAAAESAAEVAERQKQRARLEQELRDVMLSILMLANENRERIPPVLTTEVVPFPYEITVPSLSESAFGMDLLKRMLQAAPPLLS